MRINRDTTATNADLDARIAAADKAQYDARVTLALLVEERLRANLRAVFPDGGTLHADAENGDEPGAWTPSIATITDRDGTNYLTDDSEHYDYEGLMGQDAYQAVLEDVQLLGWTGEVGNIRWKYGTAEVGF